MDPTFSSQTGLPWDISPDSALDHSSSSLITVIRRDQMPEDLRSGFLPGDVILIKKPRATESTVSQTLAQARRRLAAANVECPWCRFHDTCLRLIMALAGLLILLGAPVLLTRPSVAALALYAFSHVVTGQRIHATLGRLAPEYLRYGWKATKSRAGRRCSRRTRRHLLARLSRRILSPSSVLLLQQPVVNIRSFIRYHQFFTASGARGNSGGVAEKEVDSCIRHYAAQGAPLAFKALAVSDTNSLLGLKPCRGEFTCFGYCLSRRATALYQNYGDWRRWRLAAVACERIQAGERRFLPLSIIDGHDPLDELEGRGDRKWLLVDPKLFSPQRSRRRSGPWISASRNVSK